MHPSHVSNVPQVSVVVPVYGGTQSLRELCRRAGEALGDAGWSHEVVLVDDRGDADAWPTIQALASERPEVLGLRLTRNFGQHAATICGISRSRGSWVVTLDDDLEHPPEAIPALLEAADEEHPLVYAVFGTRTHHVFRNVTSDLMRRSLSWAFPDINRDYTSFRAIRGDLARQLAHFGLNRPYIDGMLSWMTNSVRTVPIQHAQRGHGTSSYTLPKLISHAVTIFVTFSVLPLRLVTYSGAGLAAASFLFLCYVVYGKLSGSIANPGYASLMSVLLFTCGIELLILGVLGEYIGRLMGATYRRPVFLVESSTTESGSGTARSEGK